MKKSGKLNRVSILALALSVLVLVAGCTGDSNPPSNSGNSDVVSQPQGGRESKPVVLEPEASGENVLGNDLVAIDVSNASQGYIMVTYQGENPKPKLQLTCGEEETYTYNLTPGKTEVFPLTRGNGLYKVAVFENIEGTSYSTLFSGTCEVVLENEYLPFLYPNQYVWFSKESKAVELGARLAQTAADDLGVVAEVYDYVIGNITYDYEKADTVQSGYLPDIDETLETGKGICFDYAALMTAMLRTQRIPTRLVVGYAGTLYHAWISVYIEGTGWIDNIIYFDGTQWVRMDPTFAAAGEEAAKYVGDGSNYHDLYVY